MANKFFVPLLIRIGYESAQDCQERRERTEKKTPISSVN